MKTQIFAYAKTKRGDRIADQRLCFRCIDSTILLISQFEISSLELSPVALLSGLWRTLSETTKICFLAMRLIVLCSTLIRSVCLSEMFRYKHIFLIKGKKNIHCFQTTGTQICRSDTVHYYVI